MNITSIFVRIRPSRTAKTCLLLLHVISIITMMTNLSNGLSFYRRESLASRTLGMSPLKRQAIIASLTSDSIIDRTTLKLSSNGIINPATLVSQSDIKTPDDLSSPNMKINPAVHKIRMKRMERFRSSCSESFKGSAVKATSSSLLSSKGSSSSYSHTRGLSSAISAFGRMIPDLSSLRGGGRASGGRGGGGAKGVGNRGMSTHVGRSRPGYQSINPGVSTYRLSCNHFFFSLISIFCCFLLA